MANVALLATNKCQAIQDARDVLDDAAGKEFEAVVVVGIKNGTASTCKSRCLDTLALVGAIELAKHTVLANWGNK